MLFNQSRTMFCIFSPVGRSLDKLEQKLCNAGCRAGLLLTKESISSVCCGLVPRKDPTRRSAAANRSWAVRLSSFGGNRLELNHCADSWGRYRVKPPNWPILESHNKDGGTVPSFLEVQAQALIQALSPQGTHTASEGPGGPVRAEFRYPRVPVQMLVQMKGAEWC